MPQTIPPFVQFSGMLIPLRGLWNNPPVEGDKFINCELDWSGNANQTAVQIAVSGNSPVALSQIVALYVDNSRCGSDVDFMFPDSGFIVTCPAHNQGLFPVLTNALMFYVIAATASAADMTIVQILNSLPPPISILPSETQNNVTMAGLALVNSNTVLVAAPASGLVSSIYMTVTGQSAGTANIGLQDGTSHYVWEAILSAPAAGQGPIIINVPVNVRFKNGLSLNVNASTFTTGNITINVYYTSP